MKRFAFAILCVVTFGIAYLFRCRHLGAARHPLGGLRCADCGAAFADMEDAGLLPAGVQLSHLRRLFSRAHGGSVERTH